MQSSTDISVHEAANYIRGLQAMYGSMQKTVYDRVDRFRDEHELCSGLQTHGTAMAKVWTAECPVHDAVVVFEE